MKRNARGRGALGLVERLASISTLIASLELLARPRVYEDAHLMSWGVGQLRSRWLLSGPVGRTLAHLMAYRTFRALLVLRAIGSMGLVLGVVSGWRASVVNTTMAVSSILVMLRSPYGWDGADQMSAITFLGLAASSWLPEIEPAVRRFFAYQLCLSYFTSGVAKATSAEWRSGAALTGIASTEMYGNEAVYSWLKHKRWLRVSAARAVILGECAFPLVLVAPSRLRQVGLVGGILFHAVAAQIMGLNTFFWSFIAVYPALESYCRSRKWNLSGGISW